RFRPAERAILYRDSAGMDVAVWTSPARCLILVLLHGSTNKRFKKKEIHSIRHHFIAFRIGSLRIFRQEGWGRANHGRHPASGRRLSTGGWHFHNSLRRALDQLDALHGRAVSFAFS